MERYNISDIILNTETKKRFFSTVIPPTITRKNNDIYIYSQIGDRLDLLADEYYSDPSKWFIIFSANPNKGLVGGSYVIPPGIQIRIPQDTNEVYQQYVDQNKSR